MNANAQGDVASELLRLNQELLESIGGGDWETYARLCDESISCFEPETNGNLVEGMEFHRFYFDLGGASGPRNITMVGPVVRMLGDDAAVICYVRLVQRLDAAGAPVTATCQETRVWQRIGGAWRHVHFHRSL